MENKIFDFCKKTYYDVYQSTFQEVLGDSTSRNRMEMAERAAQKQAIRVALEEGVKKFPSTDISQIWKDIYKVHIFRKSGLTVDEETITKVISADQSWKKSSGHAFEELIKEVANLTLYETDVEIILQRDLTLLLRANAIANEPRDIAWLEKQVNKKVFDLYALVNHNENKYCFGCIQSKTSIRDRVTRDREPSMGAMQSYFWSVAVTLDGDFFKLPLFRGMVNGETDQYERNGWHGIYVLSNIDPEDRLYQTDIGLDLFADHALEASKYWLTQRQWFDHTWKAGHN